MVLFVFDIDGTLTDSIGLHIKCFMEALTAVGMTEVDTDWGSYTHHTDSWIFAEIFRRNVGRSPNIDERELFAAKLTQSFNAYVDDQPFNEIAGARQFVEQLQTGEAAFAFATGSFRQPAIRKLEKIGLRVPSELIATASEFETREDIVWQAVLAARAYFNVDDFERVISVGDGYWDLMTARNLGINFIGICAGTAADKMRTAGVQTMFADLLAMSVIAKEQWPSGDLTAIE